MYYMSHACGMKCLLILACEDTCNKCNTWASCTTEDVCDVLHVTCMWHDMKMHVNISMWLMYDMCYMYYMDYMYLQDSCNTWAFRRSACVYVRVHMYMYMYIWHRRTGVSPLAGLLACTADPTWGYILVCCFKAQSSKLERLFFLKRGKSDVRALRFELSKMSPQVGLAVHTFCRSVDMCENHLYAFLS